MCHSVSIHDSPPLHILHSSHPKGTLHCLTALVHFAIFVAQHRRCLLNDIFQTLREVKFKKFMMVKIIRTVDRPWENQEHTDL